MHGVPAVVRSEWVNQSRPLTHLTPESKTTGFYTLPNARQLIFTCHDNLEGTLGHLQ